MARYASLMGRRVEVHYRAGEITLPVTALLVADSGRSIFLEEHYMLRGRNQTFRWEIPYSCILRMEESQKAAKPANEHNPDLPEPSSSSAKLRLTSLRDRTEEA
ncbi:MAG TPA: hypothetical protein VJX29_03965 [Candidatus Acidoferrales bacterium]|nr:hypothetical protein [Candidatus Acidoferrales bacterium]